MGIFQELRRRKVIRVAVVYAITGWLLAQIGALLFETFAAPDWVQPVFVVLLLLGFPVAIILAWAFELTPEGMRPTRAADEGGPARGQRPVYPLGAAQPELQHRVVASRGADARRLGGHEGLEVDHVEERRLQDLAL